MYILVNVERHKNVMGDIVSNLVSSYGVPISIVDNIQKICPKCSQDCPNEEANNVEEPFEGISSTKSSASTSSNCSSSTPKIARKLSDSHDDPQRKNPKLDPAEVKMEEEDETPQFPDTQTIFENAIANAFQNSRAGFSLGTNKSLPVSDDGISNSSNLEMDDDDYTNSMCINPELLATFISQTPNLFANAAGEMAKINRLPTPSTSNSSSASKREIPNLTVNGKTRRGRIVYTQHELNILEKYYLEDPNACADLNKRKEMCNLLEIDYHRLKVWFQNRRRKDKIRSQEESISSPNGEEDMMTEMVEKMVNEGIRNCSS